MLTLNKLQNAISRFIFSDLCSLCKKQIADFSEDIKICKECSDDLEFISEPMCVKCGKPFIGNIQTAHTCGECIKKTRYYNKARSVFVYDGVIKNGIIDYKFFRNVTLAKFFEQYLLDYIKYELNNEYDVIIPVPLHKKRLRERRFNQSLFIVRSAPKYNQIKVDNSSLKRIKYTEPQLKLKGAERRKNVRGAFKVDDARNIYGKRVLLVDDIFTTGSTVDECAKVLMLAGAYSVDVLTLAKTVFRMYP